MMKRLNPPRVVRRAGLAIAALATLFGVLVAAPSPASAYPTGPMTCNYQVNVYNACISINLAGDWQVHVGLDVTMPQQYGQEIINCGNPFSASLYGTSSGYRTWLPVSPGWPGAGAGGIGVEFDKSVDWRVLNERSGTDHVYVRISLYDCHTGLTRYFTTNVIDHNF
jgi:hypothetical protein